MNLVERLRKYESVTMNVCLQAADMIEAQAKRIAEIGNWKGDTMTTSRELLQQAVEALEWWHGGEPCGCQTAINAIREHLAKPEPKPLCVAWMTEHEDGFMYWDNYGKALQYCDEGEDPIPLYRMEAP